MTVNRLHKQLKEDDDIHMDAVMKVDFLKKCKKAGLLNEFFEAILDKLHLIQDRLMSDATSESDCEEIGISLFDGTMVEDIILNFQTAIEDKIRQSEEKQRQLEEEIKLLQDLKQNLCSIQENRDPRSNSTAISSLSS